MAEDSCAVEGAVVFWEVQPALEAVRALPSDTQTNDVGGAAAHNGQSSVHKGHTKGRVGYAKGRVGYAKGRVGYGRLQYIKGRAQYAKGTRQGQTDVIKHKGTLTSLHRGGQRV